MTPEQLETVRDWMQIFLKTVEEGLPMAIEIGQTVVKHMPNLEPGKSDDYWTGYSDGFAAGMKGFLIGIKQGSENALGKIEQDTAHA